MLGYLNNEQLAKLHEVWERSFAGMENQNEDTKENNTSTLQLFLSAKQVEGCFEKSLKYYRTTLSKFTE